MPVLTKINTNVIADNAVTAAKIPAGAVDSDIGVGSVTASHIAANAVGSSEIADDAVLPANISHLGDGSGTLSGTLTGEQLRFGTAFTLTDDLTVNGDVTLGKVGDDGTGQSLTQNTSANRTLTGTGTLRMGSSMSGRGRLGSGVTFPAGHVLQVYSTNTAYAKSGISCTNTTDQDADGYGETITGVTAGNLLIATVWGGFAYYYGTAGGYARFRIGFSPNTGSDTFYDSGTYYNRTSANFNYQIVPSITARYIVGSGVTSVEVLRFVKTSASVTAVWTSVDTTAESSCGCVIMEVQQ